MNVLNKNLIPKAVISILCLLFCMSEGTASSSSNELLSDESHQRARRSQDRLTVLRAPQHDVQSNDSLNQIFTGSNKLLRIAKSTPQENISDIQCLIAFAKSIPELLLGNQQLLLTLINYVDKGKACFDLSRAPFGNFLKEKVSGIFSNKPVEQWSEVDAFYLKMNAKYNSPLEPHVLKVLESSKCEDMDSAVAYHYLAIGEYTKAKPYISRAIFNGDKDLHLYAGVSMLTGKSGFQMNPKKGHRLLKHYYEQRSVKAAVVYATRTLMESSYFSDREEAVKILKQCQSQGNVDATYHLGLLHFYNPYININTAACRAQEYFKEAALSGHIGAAISMYLFYADGGYLSCYLDKQIKQWCSEENISDNKISVIDRYYKSYVLYSKGIVFEQNLDFAKERSIWLSSVGLSTDRFQGLYTNAETEADSDAGDEAENREVNTPEELEPLLKKRCLRTNETLPITL